MDFMILKVSDLYYLTLTWLGGGGGGGELNLFALIAEEAFCGFGKIRIFQKFFVVIIHLHRLCNYHEMQFLM